MDFLNKSLAQCSELFRSMTPSARVTAGLLLAVVIVSFGYLFRQGNAGPDAYLFGGETLPEGQLIRVEAAIAQAGLSGYSREGNRIRVPAGQQAQYLAAVADAGALPLNFSTILENAINTSTVWESSATQRERLKIANQQTLSDIVRAMPWVDDAVVIYDVQDTRQPGRLAPIKQVTASVNVKPVPGESLDARRARMLQKLVASAVNMKVEDVNITNLGEGGSFGQGGEISPEIFESEYYQTKVAFEMQKRDSIMNLLRDIPGVSVQVNAELNDTAEEVTTIVKPDDKSNVRREASSQETSLQTSVDPSTQSGAFSHGPNRLPPSRVTDCENENVHKLTVADSVVSVENSRLLKTGFMPREVWATVTIPSIYVEQVWKSRNPTATHAPKEEELKVIHDQVVAKIENIVEPLVCLQVNKDQTAYKYVSVVVLDTLPGPTIEPPSMMSQATAWASRSWSTLAMLGVAIFSLMVLRGVAKNSPHGNASIAQQEPVLALRTETSGSPDETAKSVGTDAERPRLRLKTGNSLKDDLIDIVREDPDAAAEILRSWIGKAG